MFIIQLVTSHILYFPNRLLHIIKAGQLLIISQCFLCEFLLHDVSQYVRTYLSIISDSLLPLFSTSRRTRIVIFNFFVFLFSGSILDASCWWIKERSKTKKTWFDATVDGVSIDSIWSSNAGYQKQVAILSTFIPLHYMEVCYASPAQPRTIYFRSVYPVYWKH